MSSVEVKLLNVDKLNAKIHAMGAVAEKRVMQAMAMGMSAIRDDVMRSLTAEGKSGTIYPRPGGKEHQASAPGEAPSSDTGELRAGITPVLLNKEELTATIVSKAPYSSALEYGRKDGHILARPFMTPAFLGRKAYCTQLMKISLKALHLL